MLAEERRQRIADTLNARQSGAVSVAELSAALAVSGMTVRRDLDWLEELGLVRRVRGGAVTSRRYDEERPFEKRDECCRRQRQLIGRLAAQTIRDGERVILDAGTTTLEIARNLCDRAGITAVTNSLPVAGALAGCPRVSTILLGGILKSRELCTVGPTVTQELARLSVDKLFLSASGFAAERGVTDPDLQETAVKQAMIRAAKQVILVADSSKWGVTELARIAPLDALDRLVTDDDLPAGALELLEAAGVQVVTPRSAAS